MHYFGDNFDFLCLYLIVIIIKISTEQALLIFIQVLGSNMIGAFAGDIIGSVYEANPVKTTDFPLFTRQSRFTDDTVLTTATADALLNGLDYATVYRW
jgi:hypothetical protein